ncbi:MAG: O-antigen ligase family protein [Clostridia bacterium]|nr:O-antigen ligase family protein [Clostridia bacterium]
MQLSGVIRKSRYALVIPGGIAIALLNAKDPMITVALILGVIVSLYLTKRPLDGLLILLVITPFAGIEILNYQIAGIPGMKLYNLLSAVVIICFVLFRKSQPISGYERVFTYGLIILFIVSIIRSLSYIPEMYSIFFEEEYSLVRYLQSYLLKPLLVFLPFIMIVKFIRSEGEINKVIYSIFTSILLLSVFILGMYIFITPNKSDFESVRRGFGAVLHLHGNDIADFYIAVYPLLLAFIVRKRNALIVTTTLVSLLAVGILYSRTAYLVIIMSTLLFFLISSRKRYIPYIAITAAIVFLVMPPTIVERAVGGIGDKDLNDISAGRTEQIWMPLINEYIEEPVKLLIGAGRYAIMNTDVFRDNVILRMIHAHNMYLDAVLDVGVLGLAFFLYFFGKFLILLSKTHKSINNALYADMLYGIEVSLLAFLVSGFTGRGFFPTLYNAFVWIILGLGLSIIHWAKDSQISRLQSLERGVLNEKACLDNE